MNCPNCNTPLAPGTSICQRCGYNFNAQPPVNATRRFDNGPATPPPPGYVQRPMPVTPRRARQSGIPVWLAVVIVTVVAVVCSVATVLIIKSNSKSVDSELRGENESMTQVTEAVTPSEPQAVYPGDPEASCWQLKSFDWLTERPVTYADIESLTPFQRRILRNAIYAIHGYRFKSSELTTYFERFSWYEPRTSVIPNNQLSAIEQANIQLIKSYE